MLRGQNVAPLSFAARPLPAFRLQRGVPTEQFPSTFSCFGILLSPASDSDCRHWLPPPPAHPSGWRMDAPWRIPSRVAATCPDATGPWGSLGPPPEKVEWGGITALLVVVVLWKKKSMGVLSNNLEIVMAAEESHRELDQWGS